MKQKRKLVRKLLSVLLTLALVLGLMPGMGLTAYAAEQKVTFTAGGTNNGITVSPTMYKFEAFFVSNKGQNVSISSSNYNITKLVLTDKKLYSGQWGDSYLGASAGNVSFSGDTMTVTGINAKTVTIQGNNSKYATISSIDVYYDVPDGYSVTINPGSNMTKTDGSGAESQSDLSGAMAGVVYTANDGYYFPEGYSVTAVNGITVTRNSYTQITVSGTPTADATITLTAPTAKTTPDAPTTAASVNCTTADNNNGKLTGVTTAMEYKKSDADSWTAGTGSDITGLVSGTYYVRYKATDTTNASGNQELSIAGYTAPTYEVTYKVVNGTWSDDSTTDKKETVQSGSKPASVPTGMKAASGYTGGAWDTDPTDATITGATTFTYTFTALPTYEVTYKVVNGTWSDDTTTDKTETVQSGSKPASVPTGMKAASGYTGGAWDTDPTDATITGATTFTYTFTALPTYEVTYKVVNGTWSDDSTADKTENVQSGSKPASVPTGMKAASGYTGGAWDTDPTGTTITGATTFTYTFTALPSYEVTYKVVNGTWSDDTTTDKTETVQSGSKPASVPTGMKAASGYTGGAWDTDPTDATITGATTFTYTFTALPTYEVTYKVVNGTWSDDSTADKTENVQSGSKPASVPTGMKAASGYTGGAWDTDPSDATITGATTFTYTFTVKQVVATPTFSPEAGTYTETQSVTVSCATEGAEIHYTTDGSTPTASSSTYSSAITVNETTTIKAIAVKDGMTDSTVASATYTINIPPQTVATPTFTPEAGTYTEAQNVTISCATEGAVIHYTTDGSTPTASSTAYNSAITVSETTTVKAIAVKDGMTDSAVASATYMINIPPQTVATPAFSPEAGTYTEAQNVTISCATEGAVIHYTTDGSTPTASSTAYSSAITAGETTTVKAIAVKDGMTDSAVASATYTISTTSETVATPTFSPEAGTYTEAQNVTISCTTEGAVIHYTTDGSDPTSSSTTYNGAITVGDTTTVKAIAVKDGMTDSSVASATYTINDEPKPEETRVDVEGLSDGDITDDLKDKGYDTVESIEEALETALSIKTEEEKDKSELIDVKLMISTDGGTTWTAATPANFPAGGIDVVLPYPAGTNGDEYTFSVAHMVGTTANGMTAGDIEKPGTTNTSSGISTHFNGLSPVMITWTKKSSPSKKDDSKDEEKAHTHHYVWDTIEATEENDGEMRYACDICGAVQTRVPITAYYVFNKTC